MLTLQIPESGDCYSCPFMSWNNDDCMLFKEPLKKEGYYDSLETKPCSACESVRRNIKQRSGVEDDD